MTHGWLVDPAARGLEGHRRRGEAWVPVAEAAGDGVLAHPDFPGLSLPLVRLRA